MVDILTHLTLSPPQQQAVEARSSDVVVTAGAGTGKTRTLVARYLSLLADGVPLRRIVAITFTRKAAREMRNRVRADIGRFLAQSGLAPEQYKQWQAHQNGLDAARIGTIHNLCGEILRNHPAEAGIDPRFNVVDEVQSALLLQEAVEATMAWAVNAVSTGLSENIKQLVGLLSERDLQGLIRTMLYERLVMDSLPHDLSASEIFGRWQEKLETAQSQSLERLTAHPDWQDSLTTLRRNIPDVDSDIQAEQRSMVLTAVSLAETESLAGKRRELSILNEINLRGGSSKAWPGGSEQLKLVKDALKTLRGLWQNETLLAVELNSQDEALAAVMPAIYELYDYANDHYRRAKTEREALDFDDLEGLAVALLQRNAAVRLYWQQQIQALLVDEFQDTNERQRQFIRLLCPEPGKLFIVGDAKQSIYRFRGADVTVFQTERQTIQDRGGRTIKLDTSYRAHATLLANMNQLLRPVLGDDSPGRPAYVAPFDPLSPGSKDVSAGLAAPFIEFHLAVGNKGEALPIAAGGLAARLADLHHDSDLDYGNIAILCRASSSFQYYEDALDTAGIPYLTVAGKGFYDRPEVRDLMNALQATADPHDDLALAGFLRSPGCGMSDESLYHLANGRSGDQSLWETIRQGFQLPDGEAQKQLVWAVQLLAKLHNLSGRTQVADILKLFLDETNYLAALRLAGQPRALRNVAKLLADVHNSELVDVADFLEYAANLKDSGSREGEARSTAGGALQIMSIHQAKGLEFPVVVLGDAAYGGSNRGSGVLIDPDLGVLLAKEGAAGEKAAVYELGKKLNGDQESAEVDRLLYVALTRAEQILMISGNCNIARDGTISARGWLGQLAEITGLNNCTLENFDPEGEQSVTIALDVGETAVSADFYEPKFQPVYSIVAAETTAVRPELLAQVHHSLNAAVVQSGPTSPDEDRPERVWQVIPTAKRPQAPAWVIGTLVHEAIAIWRFPGPGFEKWVKARASSFGLTDKQQLDHAVKEVSKLLNRFQQWQYFQEIAGAAQRFHELPYSYVKEFGNQIETGYIDLLYLHDGRWTIVDFKTDEIRDVSAVHDLLVNKKYFAQIQRYGTAVEHLVGARPRLLICLLNGKEGIITKDIPGERSV